MATCYRQSLGTFSLSLGFNNKFIHDKFGIDMGERFHKDPDYRVSTVQEIDRQVFGLYGKIGLGFKDPVPRPSAEPFGHRFIPAMYGCPCRFAPDSEPWAEERFYSEEEILALKDWTIEDFEKADPVRETVSQAEHLHRKYGYGGFSTRPNLSSAINSAVNLRGNQLFLDYAENPSLLKKLFRHTSNLMGMTAVYFTGVDRLPAPDAGLGNCTVAMISPRNYREVNLEIDLDFEKFIEERGGTFGLHQDSDVTPHIENYSRFRRVVSCDFGMDTDFEVLARYFPHSSVNCIWFPQWVLNHTVAEMEAEVARLMPLGGKFRSFSFSLNELDVLLSEEKVLAFYEAVAGAAGRLYRKPA